MESSLKSLESLATMLAVSKMDPYAQEIVLVAYQVSNPQFVSITLLTPEGERILSTDLTGQPVEVAREAAFKKAKAGEVSYSGTRFNSENLPYAFVAAPLQSRGRVVAVLWSKLSLKSVWNVLDRIRLGKTGRAYILDSAGRFVIHPDMEKVVQGESAAPSTVAELARDRGKPVRWRDGSEEQKSYCLGASVEGLDWWLVLSQDEWETYAYLHKNIQWTIIITLILWVIGPLALWLPVKRLLSPIEKMHQQALRIGKGELDLRIEVNSRDEIGELGIAFNTMAASLKDLIHREVEMAKELLHTRNLSVLGAAASKVTHEVGNLLTNISLIVLNLRGQKLSPEAEAAVLLLEKESERVAKFIKNFLQFAKKPRLNLIEASFESTIQEIIAVYGREAERKGVRFEVEWDPKLPMIDMDIGLMHQVLLNLVKNSLDAMSESGTIKMEGSAEGDFLQLVIRDTGPGMSSDIREQIFNPFFTTKGRKGTGLGLSICRTIIEAHGGSIECTSVIGEFAAFTLTLPVRRRT